MPALIQRYVSSAAAYRLTVYSVFSAGAVLAVIASALRRHSNFYSVAVYLSKSNGAVFILANFAVLAALVVGKILQQVFFGPLRTIEVERLYDRMWFFVTESLLAFTIFRDEFDIPFALMFGLLLFTKCFHWLLADRIEWMDQRPYPGPPFLFHLRMNTLMCLLWFTDAMALLLIIESMFASGVAGTVLFASEYGILLAGLMNSAMKYCISMIDLRRASTRGGENAPPWEDKSIYIFYVDLMTDFVKLVTYLSFFMIVVAFYGLPLNIIRDVYITARSFCLRLRDLMRYRTATRNMDERYASATAEDLDGMNDNTCIICREEMVVPENAGNAGAANGPNTTPKKLPCGHIFHFHCLRSWLERQQSCPTCRRSVLEAQANQNVPNRRRVGVPPRVLEQIANAVGLPPPADQNEQIPNGQPEAGRAGGPINVNAAVPPVIPVLPNMPVQEFQGFWAPGGQWQPWPAAPAENLDDPTVEGAQTLLEDSSRNGPPAPALNPTPSDASDSSTSSSSSTTAASALFADVSHSTGESSTASRSAVGSSGPTGASSSSATASSVESTLSVREAVRAAALARFSRSSSDNSSTTATTSDRPKQSTPTTTNSSTEPAPSSERSSSVQVSSSHSVGAGPSNSTTTTSNASTQPAANQPSNTSYLPPLIPLYELSSIQTQTRPLRGLSNRSIGTQQNVRSGYTPYQHQRTGTSQRSLRTLPTALTNQQLATMDRLTREAIDERLRILDEVQNVTSRCIDELLRCRSVLPRATPRAQAETSPSRTQQQQQAAPSSSSSASIPSSSSAGPSTAVQTSTATEQAGRQEEDRPIEIP